MNTLRKASFIRAIAVLLLLVTIVIVLREPPPAKASSGGESVKVLAIGDSITYGFLGNIPMYPLGDVNLDYVVDEKDIELYTKWLNGTVPIPPVASAAFKRGDTFSSEAATPGQNTLGDGKITEEDKNTTSRVVSGGYDQAFFGVHPGTMSRTTDMASYRLPLYQLFRRSGQNFIFVGTKKRIGDIPYDYAGYPVDSEDYPLPDEEEMMHYASTGQGASGVAADIEEALTTLETSNNTPDVALIHLGTNGITNVEGNKTALGKIVGELQKANPLIKVYIAQIIPAGNPSPCMNSVTFFKALGGGCNVWNQPDTISPVKTYFDALRAWCLPDSINGKCANISIDGNHIDNVFLVDHYTNFDAENWLSSSDEIHPNRQGECQMALTWYEALRNSGFALPEPPADFCDAYVVPEIRETTRVSVNSEGLEGNGDSWVLGGNNPISADGRYIVFSSKASNLDSRCNNGKLHIFIHDRQTGGTNCISVNSNKEQGNGDSTVPSITANGNIVTFISTASNLDAKCVNGNQHVFVHDRSTSEQTITCISINYQNDSQADGSSDHTVISAGGRYVAFTSTAKNLDSTCTNGQQQIFVLDREKKTITCASVNTNNAQGNAWSWLPSISADGQYIAFDSQATNLVDGDPQSNHDVFVRILDSDNPRTIQVSLETTAEDQRPGNSGYPAISADGRYVSFYSARWPGEDELAGTPQFDIFVRDLGENKTIKLSRLWITGSTFTSISTDGRYVATMSYLEGRVGMHAVVYDRHTDRIYPVSRDSSGNLVRPYKDYGRVAISGNGRYAAFTSDSPGVVANDKNQHLDVFVHDLGTDLCAPVEGNLIANSCFDDSKVPWKLFHTNWQATYTLSTDNPYAGTYSAQLAINASARNIQFYQRGFALQPNTTYELSFAAKSNNGRDMRVYVQKHGEAYFSYGLTGQRAYLEPYWKWFTMTFTTPDLADMNDARLRFWLAPFARAETVYFIDHVVLRPTITP